MLINIKSDYTLSEIEYRLSLQTTVKYPKRYTDYDLGINWVSAKRGFLCLFYNDGTEDGHRFQSLVRAYFYGKIISTKNGCRIVGIACPELFFLILSLVVFVIAGINLFYAPAENIFGVLFVVAVFMLFNLNMSEGFAMIKSHLKSRFSADNE